MQEKTLHYLNDITYSETILVGSCGTMAPVLQRGHITEFVREPNS